MGSVRHPPVPERGECCPPRYLRAPPPPAAGAAVTAAAFSPLFASRLHEQDNMAPAGAAPEAECVTALTRAGRTGTPLAAIFAKGRRAERRGHLSAVGLGRRRATAIFSEGSTQFPAARRSPWQPRRWAGRAPCCCVTGRRARSGDLGLDGVICGGQKLLKINALLFPDSSTASSCSVPEMYLRLQRM